VPTSIELINKSDKGFELIKKIATDSRHGLEIQNTYYDYLFDIIQSGFESLESVSKLALEGKFKDSFTILRSVFETTLFFWLMVHGKKYRLSTTYKIKPKERHSSKETRDNTLQKWRELKKSHHSSFEDILQMQPEGEDKIKVSYEYEGMYEDNDKNRTGEFIPFYWSVLAQHYDQFSKFNLNLPSIKTGNIFDEKKNKETSVEQNTLYSKYMHIDAIIKNLVLNNLISKTQEDYVRIHYNFLSSYTHPTKEMFQFKRENTAGFITSDIPEDVIKEQILLYICRLQYHLLKILLERIEKYNPNAKIQDYKDHINILDSITSHFWFIDNNPTKYDITVSEQMKRMAKTFAGKETDEIIMYYENPLQRLCNLKSWSQ